jgi:PhoPQ-activated pathogenicity-related protein
MSRFPADWPTVRSRTEDAVIAFTWRHFINGSSPYWLLRMPMTKAVVKAMDTVQTFVKTKFPNITPIQQFVVAGASKRGWTTWTTMAVDKRVAAAAPIVMPIANMVPNLNHQYNVYGGWSFALDDYRDEGLMGFLNTPPWQKVSGLSVFLRMYDSKRGWCGFF